MTLEDQVRREFEALFDLQHARIASADAEYVAAHPRPDCPHGYKPDLGTLVKWLRDERDELRRRLAVKCEHPEASRCARLWQADHNRRQLESVSPELADEFPWGCDTVVHLGAALLDARRERDQARDEIRKLLAATRQDAMENHNGP